ncbi:hypothetical protein ACOMHN_050356 [Nucella lapillus]
MTDIVLYGGEASEPFEITNGVKQGCVLAPVVFNLFFTCVLSYAVRDIEDGVYIRYRMDGSLFDFRRLSAETKTTEKLILEALFADDCALMAHMESALQLIVNKFSEASRLFGLTISLGKTEVLFQPSPLTPGHHPSISIEGTELKYVWRNSNTSVVSFPVMAPSTKRSTPGSARQVKPWADCGLEC